jgi:uncharacterized membrane protein
MGSAIFSIICKVLITVLWIWGIIIAKGFWWTLLAIVFAPYAIYLSIVDIFS